MEAPRMKKVELTPDQIDELTCWAGYLRTSGLQQGTARLRTGDEYCCLGVLADLAHPGDWCITSKENTIRHVFYLRGYSTLLYGVGEKLGVGFRDQGELAFINDHESNFNKVIRYIEEKL